MRRMVKPANAETETESKATEVARILSSLPIRVKSKLARTAAVVFAALGCAFTAAPAAAQLTESPIDSFTPKLARGTQFTALEFQDIDSISPFNGSLNLRIPLGQVYSGGGNLSYQLVAYYNSNEFDAEPRQFRESPTEPLEEKVLSFPSANSNAGIGWAVHLGRLLPPEPLKPAWRYIQPDNSVVYFHDTLHGEPSLQGDLSYSRDGSYMRMKRINATIIDIEMPNGDIHRFVKANSTWPDWKFNKDEWRLWSIRDRSNNGAAGNIIIIRYTTDGWWIRDPSQREHKVYYESDPWYNGRIDKVEVATFGGAKSIYDFVYVDAAFNWVQDARLVTRTVGRLSAITRPDGATYEFDRTSGTFNDSSFGFLRSAGLPSGGTLEWSLSPLVLPDTAECVDGPSSGFSLPRSVTRRTLKNKSGGVLEDTRYGYETYASPSIPSDFCITQDGLRHEPHAELASATFQPHNGGRATMEVRYFSVWPFGRDGAGVDVGGWKSEDFGQNFTRDRKDSQGRMLSSQLYDCTDPGTDINNPRAFAGAHCSLKESTYVTVEHDYVSCSTAPASDRFSPNLAPADFRCLDANHSTTTKFTFFHDDGGKFIEVRNEDNDGFGNYRFVTRTGTISNKDRRVIHTNVNSGRGTLRRRPNGEIADTSTWTNVPATGPWILAVYPRRWVEGADGKIFKETTCHYPNTPLLRRVRVHANTATGADAPNDLIYEYFYNDGDMIETRVYGGDKQQLPTGAGCNYSDLFERLGGPAYTITASHQHGTMKAARIKGSTVTLLDHAIIDQNTGLPKQSRDPSGQITYDYEYDNLGRLTKITDSAGPETTVRYFLPGLNNFTGIPRIDTTVAQGTVPVNYVSQRYDEAGRNVNTFSHHETAGLYRVARSFDQAGRVSTESVPQLSTNFVNTAKTAYTYDFRGRPLTIKKPDGKTTSIRYTGIRLEQVTQNVGVSDTSTGVGEVAVTTESHRDQFGNVVKIVEPIASGVSKTTTHAYNGLDQLISAVRTGAASQTRTFTYDGRGFLTEEKHPEYGFSANGAVRYSQYDALGNVGRIDYGASSLQYVYDKDGRVVQIKDARNYILSEFQFGTVGHENGRMTSATRYNYLDQQNTGGALWALLGQTASARKVTYVYTYGSNGLPMKRRIEVWDTKDLNLGNTTDDHLMAAFEQSWEYDPANRIKKLTYPKCAIWGCHFIDQSPPAATFEYGRNSALLSVSSSVSGTTTLGYHPNGLLNTVTHANGKVDAYGMPADRTPRIGSINLASGMRNLGAYSYDGAGNITKIGPDKFIYDYNRRLVREYVPGGPSNDVNNYTYDEFDNLVVNGSDFFSISRASNRFTQAGVAYNASGEITDVGTFKFFRDDFGKMESLIGNPNRVANPCTNVSGRGDCWFYWYGPDEQRIGGLFGKADGTGAFFWTVRDLDGKVLRTYENASADLRPVKDYVYAGSRLLSTRAFNTGEKRYFHTDHLGTPRIATSAAGWSFGTRNTFAYGRQRFGEADLVNEPTVDWAGYEKNPDGLLHNLSAREYFSLWGRFLTPDPARDGWNLYAYANNNPINRIDPTGLASKNCNDVSGPEEDQGEDRAQCTITADNFDPERTDGQHVVFDPAGEDDVIESVINGMFETSPAEESFGYTELGGFVDAGGNVQIQKPSHGSITALSSGTALVLTIPRDAMAVIHGHNFRGGHIAPGLHGRNSDADVVVGKGTKGNVTPHPNIIVHDDRAVVLERNRGQFQVRVLTGSLRPNEISKIQRRLDVFQKRYDKNKG